MKTDIQILNCGSVFQFFWLTERGKNWIDENVSYEAWQLMGKLFVIDHRFAGPLAIGMVESGLTVE